MAQFVSAGKKKLFYRHTIIVSIFASDTPNAYVISRSVPFAKGKRWKKLCKTISRKRAAEQWQNDQISTQIIQFTSCSYIQLWVKSRTLLHTLSFAMVMKFHKFNWLFHLKLKYFIVEDFQKHRSKKKKVNEQVNKISD